MKGTKNPSLSKKIIGLSFMITLFILGLALTNFTFAQGSMKVELPKQCLDVLKPAVEKLGMTVEDLEDPAKAMKFKEHYMNKKQWKPIHSACAPDFESMANLGSCCNPCYCSVSECCYWAGRFCNNCQCCPGEW